MKPKPFNVNFDLGLNTKYSPKKLKDGECSICQDVYLDQVGSILTRRFKNNYLSFNSKPVSLFKYTNLITQLINGDLYNSGNLIGSNYGTIPFKYIEYNNVLYFVNKLKQFRYDNFNIYPIGNAKPTIAPYIADSGDAGNLDGSYYYKYTYVDLYGKESSASPESNEIALVTNQMDVVIAPSTSDKIIKARLYRIGGTLTDWYYVAEIPKSTMITGATLTGLDADTSINDARSVWGDGNFIYVANGTGGLASFSVDDAGQFTAIDTDDQGDTYMSVCGDGNFIYCACAGGGLRSYSVSSAGVLTFIDGDYQGGSYSFVWCDGKFIYCSNNTLGLMVYRVDGNGILTFVSSYYLEGICSCVHGDGNFIYMTCGVMGVQVYKVDDLGNISFKSKYYQGFSASNGVWCDNNFIYVADGGNLGLSVFAVDNNGNIRYIDNDVSAGVGADSVWGDGNFIYVATNGVYSLAVYYVDDNGNITYLTSVTVGGTDQSFGVFADEKFVYWANDTAYIRSYKFGYVYTDNIADSSLTELFDANNNDPPPSNLYYLIEHYERLIGARTVDYPNSILYSVEFEPEYWGNALSQQYLLGGNDECTGLMSWGRFIVFWKKHQIYVMEGEDPTEWQRRRADSAKGNISPYAIDFWKLPIFCSYSGLHVFDGNLDTKVSEKVDSWFYNNRYYLPNAVGKVYEDKYYFGVDNGETLVYDLKTGNFVIHKYGLSAIAYDHINNLLLGGIGNNVVKLEEENNNNNADTVYFKIKSKAYPLHDVEGRLGELKDYIVQIDTKLEDVSFNIYIDDILKQTITLNTDHMKSVSGTFNALSGYYAEFEFVYTGAKRIQLDVPVIINQTRIEATNA